MELHPIPRPPGWKQVSVSAPKHTVIGLTLAAGLENAKYSIYIDAIEPGTVLTPMTARWLDDPEHGKQMAAGHLMGRPGEPEEIANLVLFLASDAANYINARIHNR